MQTGLLPQRWLVLACPARSSCVRVHVCVCGGSGAGAGVLSKPPLSAAPLARVLHLAFPVRHPSPGPAHRREGRMAFLEQLPGPQGVAGSAPAHGPR